MFGLSTIATLIVPPTRCPVAALPPLPQPPSTTPAMTDAIAITARRNVRLMDGPPERGWVKSMGR